MKSCVTIRESATRLATRHWKERRVVEDDGIERYIISEWPLVVNSVNSFVHNWLKIWYIAQSTYFSGNIVDIQSNYSLEV